MSLKRKHRASGSAYALARQLVSELLSNDVSPNKMLSNGTLAKEYAILHLKKNREKKKYQNKKRTKTKKEKKNRNGKKQRTKDQENDNDETTQDQTNELCENIVAQTTEC